MGTYPTTIQSFGAITMALPDRTHGPDIRLPIFKEGFGIMVKLAGITIGTLFSQCNGLTLQDEYKKNNRTSAVYSSCLFVPTSVRVLFVL